MLSEEKLLKLNNYMDTLLEVNTEDLRNILDSNHEMYLKTYIAKTRNKGAQDEN